MSVAKGIFCTCIFAFSFFISEGQQIPFSPVSYKIFSPFVFNPAITGSKDYSNINVIASFHKKTQSQILIGDTRLSKTVPGYFSSPDIREFRNIGIGGSVFNESNNAYRNVGAIAAGAYHVPLNKKGFSFLSLGASIKGIYNTPDTGFSGDSLFTYPTESIFHHNLDLGIYYYNSRFYAGVSTTNFLDNLQEPDSLNRLGIPVSRQYFFLTGYKFILNRSLNIILEPSLIVTAVDLSFQKMTDNIHPAVKLYLMDFCLGYYYDDDSAYSFFFQYRYPRFLLGAYFELPRKSAYYIREPVIEITAGINFSRKKFRLIDHSRW